jgi:hypothetical protein
MWKHTTPIDTWTSFGHESSDTPDHAANHDQYVTDHFQPAARRPTRITVTGKGQVLRLPEDQAIDFLALRGAYGR